MGLSRLRDIHSQHLVHLFFLRSLAKQRRSRTGRHVDLAEAPLLVHLAAEVEPCLVHRLLHSGETLLRLVTEALSSSERASCRILGREELVVRVFVQVEDRLWRLEPACLAAGKVTWQRNRVSFDGVHDQVLFQFRLALIEIFKQFTVHVWVLEEWIRVLVTHGLGLENSSPAFDLAKTELRFKNLLMQKFGCMRGVLIAVVSFEEGLINLDCTQLLLVILVLRFQGCLD